MVIPCYAKCFIWFSEYGTVSSKIQTFLIFFPEIFKIHEVFNKIKSMSYFANKILIKFKIDFFPKNFLIPVFDRKIPIGS